ncbi:MAG: peptidylprolyl isomerase [Clostridium sp.]|nr:peptidylprolyl isomerase [Clostridium sp.]
MKYTSCFFRHLLTLVTLLFAIFAAEGRSANPETSRTMNQTAQTTPDAGDRIVTLRTTAGDIRLRLYGDTPKHQQNFIRLASEGYYDGLLFHRVISDFMIQGGDPESRNAPAGKMLGAGDPSYQIDAEIRYPEHFHRRGALAAARQGDATNPERRSSGSQFYIVTGKVYTDAQLDTMEKSMERQALQDQFNRLAGEQRDTIMALRRNRDLPALRQLQDELAAKATEAVRENPPRFTAEQREAYTTVGGTPHLDGTYTVYGEVIDGMDVVDRIQHSETDRNDRPLEDVRILSVEIDK